MTNGLRHALAKREVRAGIALAVIAALERWLLIRHYAPIEFSDTQAYFRLAQALARPGWEGYDGTRVPGYPAFLAVLSRDPAAIWHAQLVLGWALALVWFLITLRLTRSPGLAFVVGSLGSVIPGIFLFESNLLTESLTAFLGTAALGIVLVLDRIQRPGVRLAAAVGAGTLAAWAGMVRALFFAFPLWLIPFLWTAGPSGRRSRLLEAGFFLAPAVLFLGGWLLYIERNFGMISPDTMGGYHLIQHTGAFFELLPDEDAVLRETYLRFRDERMATRGDQTNTIWDAIPAMSEASGLGFYDLSRELQRLSWKLILAHPDRYAASAWEGWVSFWKAPVYWDASQMQPAALRSAVSALAIAGRAVCWAANGAFLVLGLAAAFSRRVRTRFQVDRAAILFGGWVVLASILQTLPDHGDNPRFLVPLQMIVLLVIARAAYAGIRRPIAQPT